MKQTIVTKLLVGLIILSFYSYVVQASNLDGKSNVVFTSNHSVFHDGDFAQGFVRINNGFTILPFSTATFDLLASVSGDIDLRTSGVLQLIGDMCFDVGVTVTRSGFISGRGNKIILHDKLVLPSNSLTRIVSDTDIDGGEHILQLNPNARIVIDSNVTLTLRNMRFINSRNHPMLPCIECQDETSKLAFVQVQFVLGSDFDFKKGQLFFHRDVFFTGTNAFIYSSNQQSYIIPGSTLGFDYGTSFSYAPVGNSSENLINILDQNSSLIMRGCSICLPGESLDFSMGRILREGDVKTQRYAKKILSTLITSTSLDYGNTCTVYALAWNTRGDVLAVGGTAPGNGAGGFGDVNEIRLYLVSNSSFTPLTSLRYGSSVNAFAWNTDGRYLAVGGSGAVSGGGFSNTDELRVYSFDGSTLTAAESMVYGTSIQSIKWSPCGKYVAVGGSGAVSGGGFANTNELRIYRFDDANILTSVTSKAYGDVIKCLSWHPSGRFLAVGGEGAANGSGDFSNNNEIRVYSFDGSSLSAVTSQDYGSGVESLEWNPDGLFLAVGGFGAGNGLGGFSDENELRVYSFDGSSLDALTSKDFGIIDDNGIINSLSWDSSGRHLVVAGSRPILDETVSNSYEYIVSGSDVSIHSYTITTSAMNDVRIYSFDGTDLTLSHSRAYGADCFVAAWHPMEQSIAFGGSAPFMNVPNSLKNNNEVILCTAMFQNEYSPSSKISVTYYGNNLSFGGSL